MSKAQEIVHNAEAAALGFYYQAYFALETLLLQTADDAAVAVERLDDVELVADGQTLLFQLKHSLLAKPAPITIASRALWRTVAVWIDLLPTITIADTTLHLVAVGAIEVGCPLHALTKTDVDRSAVVQAMVEEAQRVVDERANAKMANVALPHSERARGCEFFLGLGDTDRLNLLRRAVIRSESSPIDKIEARIAGYLLLLPAEQRSVVAARLVEWWDRQVVHSLCGVRSRAITRLELQQQIMSIVGDLEEGRLFPEFELATPPDDYQPHGMLTRQIQLVGGKPSDLSRAIREEWRAREQRSQWVNANPAMAVTINEYDVVLREQWSDRHEQMAEDVSAAEDRAKCEAGLKLLRWTHEDAPGFVRPISDGWSAAYYVRGSYQVLAINRKVGWHPNYAELLAGDE